MALQRLDRIISSQTGLSRKTVRDKIRAGRAQVNGETVRDAGFLTDAEQSRLTFDGQALAYKKFIYIVMNKPADILSASVDKSRKTVVDLVPDNLKRKGLFPVGRLDRDTTGLLLITDDGDFAHKILSPKNEIFKTYIAELDGSVTDDAVEHFSRGIILADGTVCRKAYLKPLGKNRAEIKICEGRYHQIKRMFGTEGLGVNALKRLAIGNYFLPSELPEGACLEDKYDNLFALIFDK